MRRKRGLRRGPLEESPWARVPPIIIRSNRVLEEGKEREGDDETSGGREGMEEYRVCGSTGSELTGV